MLKELRDQLRDLLIIAAYVAIIFLPQCAWNTHSGLILMDTKFTLRLVLLNLLTLFVYVAVWATMWLIDQNWIRKHYVTCTLYYLTSTFLLWSLGWMSYISRQPNMTVLVPEWGEYSLIGPRIFWFTIMAASIVLCAITRSIAKEIAVGEVWTFRRLLMPWLKER
jgi:hypothetical protein